MGTTNPIIINFATLLKKGFQDLSQVSTVEKEQALMRILEWIKIPEFGNHAWNYNGPAIDFAREYSNDLYDMVRWPFSLNQKGLGLCGSTLVTYALFNFYPRQMTEAAINLFETGTCSIGNVVISADNLRSTEYLGFYDYMKVKQNQRDGVSPFLFVFVGTICANILGNMNPIRNYDECFALLNAGTTVTNEADFLDSTVLFMPINSVAVKQNDKVNAYLDLIAAYKGTSGLLALRIDSSVLDVLGAINNPPVLNHVVGLMSLPVVNNQTNRVVVQLYNWGISDRVQFGNEEGVKIYDLDQDSFISCFFSYYTIEPL